MKLTKEQWLIRKEKIVLPTNYLFTSTKIMQIPVNPAIPNLGIRAVEYPLGRARAFTRLVHNNVGKVTSKETTYKAWKEPIGNTTRAERDLVSASV